MLHLIGASPEAAEARLVSARISTDEQRFAVNASVFFDFAGIS